MMKYKIPTGDISAAFVAAALVLVLSAIPEQGFAISPMQLQASLNRGERVTIIDIRSRASYTEGHIPGAISIPFPMIAEKRLPPLGAAVVYGDGIRTDLTLEALRNLNARRGLKADILEGGFPAWEALGLTTTHKSGFQKDRLPSLSYEEFEKAAAGNPDIVMVDMRSAPAQGGDEPSGRQVQALGVSGSELTDLSEAFPGLRTIRLDRREAAGPGGRGGLAYGSKPQSPGKEWDISVLTGAGGKDVQARRLYVLIDDGDGEAGKVAHRLKAAGIKRLVILTGGEGILRREGRPGLETINTRDK